MKLKDSAKILIGSVLVVIACSGGASDSVGPEIIPNAMAQEALSIVVKCDTLGEDYNDPASQLSGYHAYRLFAVAKFPSKSRNDIGAHVLAYTALVPDSAFMSDTVGYPIGYYTIQKPYVQDGLAMMYCGTRFVDDAKNTTSDSMNIDSVEFVYTP